jgi:two-component system cell cycle response regulator
VRSLARLKVLADELMMRASTTQDFRIDPGSGGLWGECSAHGQILLVEDHLRSAQRIAEGLISSHKVKVEGSPQSALLRLAEDSYDLLIVSLSLADADGLRLCSQVRSLDRTRHLPIIMLVDPGDDARLLRGLDMGVNDYVVRPLDRNELLARIKTQIKRKRHADLLRAKLDQGMEHAITDPLTGLHNRRYMESHLGSLVTQATQSGQTLSILVADIDYFKKVNDTYGHDAGDNVLREFATRLRRNTRGIDLACRLGGEEFVIIMPDTELPRALQVAERLRACIASEPFQVNAEIALEVTASVGVSTLERREDTPETLFKRADTALYSAKRRGRNRVVTEAA